MAGHVRGGWRVAWRADGGTREGVAGAVGVLTFHVLENPAVKGLLAQRRRDCNTLRRKESALCAGKVKIHWQHSLAVIYNRKYL